MSLNYKLAGVDVKAGYKAVELIKGHAAATLRKEVLSGIGGFGALFSIAAAKEMEEPVLVSGTDGVGTKLKIAFLMDRHDTVGLDCVAMCVNDIICSGAEPLFFLDYIACGKNYPDKISEIVKGVADGCVMAGCSLIGGEIAEMPGVYPKNEYDIAGFAVGLLDRAKIIDGSGVKDGDVIIGLASNGIHSNGYTLVREIFRPNVANLAERVNPLKGTLGEELMRPTKIYVKTILEITKKFKISAISNITGGGFFENIPRALPESLGAKIIEGTWEVLPIFEVLQKIGSIKRTDMYNTFNMGIGMIMIVSPKIRDEVMAELESMGEKAYIIGETVRGKGVELCLK